MLRSGALRSTDSELVQACIKGLTALFALHNNRLAARADTRAMNKGKKAMKELNSLMPAGNTLLPLHCLPFFQRCTAYYTCVLYSSMLECMMQSTASTRQAVSSPSMAMLTHPHRPTLTPTLRW